MKGAGGQKNQKTSNAVRCLHEATGVVGEAWDSRSQTANKIEAWKKVLEHPKFKTWLRLEIARRSGNAVDYARLVSEEMSDRNIKTEIQIDGRWIEVDAVHD